MSTATATRPQSRAATPARAPRSAPSAPRSACPGPAGTRAVRPVAPGPVEPGARTRVHLTGRGRALVLLVLVALLFAAFAVGRSVSHASVVRDSGGPTLTQITVQSGDTLWSVSCRLAPHRDPREVVQQLQRLNDLSTSELQVGQQLLLPLAV